MQLSFFIFIFFLSNLEVSFMKIESWQLSNLLKAYFQSVIQSALHNPVNKPNSGAPRGRLMIQMRSEICWHVVHKHLR